MKQCLMQPPLLVKEWVVTIRGYQLAFEQSRGLLFTYEFLQFIMVLWLLFGETSSYVGLAVTGLVLLLPWARRRQRRCWARCWPWATP